MQACQRPAVEQLQMPIAERIPMFPVTSSPNQAQVRSLTPSHAALLYNSLLPPC